MQLLILLLCFAAPCLSGRVRFSDDSDRRDVPSQYYQQQDRNIGKADFYSQYLQLHSINPERTRDSADYSRYSQGINGYNQQDRTGDSADYSRYSQGVNGYNQQDRARDSAVYSRYSQGINGYNQQDRNTDKADIDSQYLQLHSIHPDRTRNSADYSRYSQGIDGYYNQQDRNADKTDFYSQYLQDRIRNRAADSRYSQEINGYNQQDRTRDSAVYSRYSQGINGYNQQDRDNYAYGRGHYSQYNQDRDSNGYGGGHYSQYDQENKYKDRMTDAQIAKVLELVNSVSDQVNRAYLRENLPGVLPPTIEIEGIKGPPEEVKVHLLQEGSALPAAIGALLLRQAASEPTLGSMGETIVIPGTGPVVDLEIEGDLAEQLKKMTISELIKASGTKQYLQMPFRWGR